MNELLDPLFHGGNTGSIPVGRANKIKGLVCCLGSVSNTYPINAYGRAMNIPIGEFSGSNATNELHRTIERIQAENARQSRWMLALTAIAAIAALIAAWPVVKDWLHAVNVL